MTKSINKTKQLDKSNLGFAAGTLVHTKEGLVPIEQIKVGDYVLSKPESGEGEQEYKRVTKTFTHPPTRVIRLTYFLGDDRTRAYAINTTLNHPFWVVDKGWTAVEDLKGRWAGDDILMLCDGSHAALSRKSPIYISDQPGVGWISSTSDDKTDRPGTLWDFMNHRLVATKAPHLKILKMLSNIKNLKRGKMLILFTLNCPYITWRLKTSIPTT